MYEDAQEIFDYLPIRRDTPENDYLEYLWSSFSELEKSELSARSFCVMPFHLLFMMAMQYKVLRVSRINSEACNLFFCGVAGRSKNELLSDKKSVFDIALNNERTIPEIFQLVGLDNGEMKSVKTLIDERNDTLAHAKGGIEQKPEEKIGLYLQAIESIQQKFKRHNENLANSWLTEIEAGDNMEQFLETHFLDSCFSPRDFGDVIGTLLEAEHLDFDQWEQVVNKGLEFAHNQTILALRELATNEIDDGKRFNAIRILDENGEIDEEMKKSIIEDEKDEEILELLKS